MTLLKLLPKNHILKGAQPEVLNAGQIAKLKKHQQYEESFYDGEIDLEHPGVSVKAIMTVYFTCPECGNPDVCVRWEDESVQNDLKVSEYSAVGECLNCKCKFEVNDGVIEIVENPIHPEKLGDEDEDGLRSEDWAYILVKL